MLEENARSLQPKEIWPPSYAEFIGYAKQKPTERSYKLFHRALPVPPEVQERRKEIALKNCENLLSLFDE
tara:strand:+ start:6836 stop:7045 length:210 start_codon:yes stop_codon:yes gene_type:complete